MDIITLILARQYTDSAIRDIASASYQVVDELPERGEPGIIYLVHVAGDKYSEYIWQNGEFVKLKDTTITSALTVGYYYAGVFWKEAEHLNRLPDYVQSIYMDEPNKELYCYDSEAGTYKAFLQKATSTRPGIAKLYDDSGDADDGAMTQRSVTRKLRKKVEVDTTALESDECLGLSLNKA